MKQHNNNSLNDIYEKRGDGFLSRHFEIRSDSVVSDEKGGLIVTLTASTEHACQRYDWRLDKDFLEILDYKDVDLTRLRSANAYLNHMVWNPDHMIGVVESANVTNDKLICVVRISKRKELEPFIAEIRDGIIKNVSIGYRLGELIEEKEDGGILKRRYKFEPFEVSILTMPPADPHAGITDKRNAETPPSVVEGSVQPPAQESAATPLPIDIKQERSQAKNEGIQAERERVASLEKLRDMGSVDHVEFNEIVSMANDTVATANAKIIKFISEKRGVDAVSLNVDVTKDEKTKKREQFSSVILGRAGIEAPDPENEYRGCSLSELIKYDLGLQRCSNAEAVNQFLSRGGMTTSDLQFSLIDTMRYTVAKKKELLEDYVWRLFCDTGSLPDFRETESIDTGGIGTFEPITEQGEYVNKTFSEGKLSRRLARYGIGFRISYESLINDTYDFLSAIPDKIIEGSEDTIEELFYKVLYSNEKLKDGYPLFHSSRKNLNATATAITYDNLKKRLVYMATIKDNLNKNKFLRQKLEAGLFGVEQSLKAMDYEINENNPENANKQKNIFHKSFKVYSSNAVQELDQFYFANKKALRADFLNGNQSPEIIQLATHSLEGLEYKASLSVGISVQEPRNIFKQTGL